MNEQPPIPDSSIEMPGEMRFMRLADFKKWAKGNEARYPLRIQNVGVVQNYPKEIIIPTQAELNAEVDQIDWFCQQLIDEQGFVKILQE